MPILAIDTSTSASSIAIFNVEKIIALDFQDSDAPQSESLMCRIDHLLTTQKIGRTDLTAVCVCIGPGSFTGIRVGIATAKAICIALQIPLVAFNSLELLAVNIYATSQNIMAILDARMSQAYVAVYDSALAEIVSPHTVDYAGLRDLVERYKPICVGDVHLFISDNQIKTALPHQNIKTVAGMCSLLKIKDIVLSYDIECINTLEPFYVRPVVAPIS